MTPPTRVTDPSRGDAPELPRTRGYDRANRFFQEDFDELRQAGYLAIAVPRELGEAASPSRNACASPRLRRRIPPARVLRP